MASHSDLPPTHTTKPLDMPPDSSTPTSAMLKGDIDSGRTGDKNDVFDPGLSPLGTDDEAAGTPPSPKRVALARHHEGVQRWMKGSGKATAAFSGSDGALAGFVGFIVLVAVIFAGALWLI